MIEVLSSWAKGIGVTIVIISIFEMILPNNNSKKYIRMVLGVYLIFNIISPLVSNKEAFNINDVNLEEMTTSSNIEVNQTSMNLRIKNLYEEELEKDITKKLKDKGYEVTTCKVTTQISTKEDEETKINKIKIKITKSNEANESIEESTENKIVSEIQKIKKVDTTIKKDEDKENEENKENSKNDKKENKKITRCRYSKCEEIFNR